MYNFKAVLPTQETDSYPIVTYLHWGWNCTKRILIKLPCTYTPQRRRWDDVKLFLSRRISHPFTANLRTDRPTREYYPSLFATGNMFPLLAAKLRAWALPLSPPEEAAGLGDLVYSFHQQVEHPKALHASSILWANSFSLRLNISDVCKTALKYSARCTCGQFCFRFPSFKTMSKACIIENVHDLAAGLVLSGYGF